MHLQLILFILLLHEDHQTKLKTHRKASFMYHRKFDNFRKLKVRKKNNNKNIYIYIYILNLSYWINGKNSVLISIFDEEKWEICKNNLNFIYSHMKSNTPSMVKVVLTSLKDGGNDQN